MIFITTLFLNCYLLTKVVSIKEFGAFLSIENSDRHGLLHKSSISNHPIDNVADVLDVGERVFVKIISDKVTFVTYLTWALGWEIRTQHESR